MADKVKSQEIVKQGELEGFAPLKQPDYSCFIAKGDVKTVESSEAHDKSSTVKGINAGKKSKFGR